MSPFVYGSRPFNTFPYNADPTAEIPTQVFIIEFRGYINQIKSFRALTSITQSFKGFIDSGKYFGRHT